MIFLSTLLRRPVYDSDNQRVGTLRDLYVSLQDIFPKVTALVVKSDTRPIGPDGAGNGRRNGGSGPLTGSQELIIPWEQVVSLEEETISLNVPAERIESLPPGGQAGDLRLARDLLDKQIVDTQGFRVVKVNDLKLAQLRDAARLVGADISLRALLRRLGAERPLAALAHVLPIRLPERTITWNYIEPIEVAEPELVGAAGGSSGSGSSGSGEPRMSGMINIPQVRLNVSHAKIAELRPADIADILEQLDVAEGGAILEQLDTETAADALEEVEAERQAALVSELDPERASDLLELIAPDNAADILGELDAEEAERLLNLMPAEESRPIRELMRYGEQTAGGIMTTEVLSLPAYLTVEETLALLRSQSSQLEMVYYLYVVDDARQLVGVVSLRQLVTSDPATRLEQIMDTDVIRVHVNDDQEEVARVIARYDLLAVPVVDLDERLVGLITVDDVIDIIEHEGTEDVLRTVGSDAEELERLSSSRIAMLRMPWIMATMFIELLAGVVIHIFDSTLTQVILLASFMPIISAISGNTGLQSAAIIVRGLSTGHVDPKRWRHAVFRQVKTTLLLGAATGVMLGAIGALWDGKLAFGLVIFVGMFTAVNIAGIVGTIVPLISKSLGFDPALTAGPFETAFQDVVGISIFLSIATLSLKFLL
jgi:magnesium transporter